VAQLNITFDLAVPAQLPTEEAFAKTLPELAALPDSEAATINIDLNSAFATVVGCLPEIRAMRGQIEAEWPNFDLVRFDKLEQYALALAHAQAQHRSARKARTSVAGEAAELVVIRDRMLFDAQSLARHGLIDGAPLEKLRMVAGYKALAGDVLTLHSTFKDAWSKIEGKTPYTLEDVQRAGVMALDFFKLVGLREQSLAQASEAMLQRQKLFTLFARAYDDARRAVHYLRFEAGDAESIAPSLYVGRSSRRRAEEKVDVIAGARDADAAAGGATSPASSRPTLPSIVIENRAGVLRDNPFTS
jgi:hypothetical protein